MSLCGRGFLRLRDDGVESGLGLTVDVEQERFATPSPGVRVIGAPERDHLDVFVVLEECTENTRVSLGQLAIGIADQASLGGRGVVRDVGPKTALTALRAVDVEF